ncbi:response regulator [Oceanicola granulosus]|nr:response regulator [Oceanicola granulosus]
MDTLEDFLMTRPPTRARPLLGATILVVEDSRYACEALRLLSLRSGARIRRADSLANARRHLRVYRPTVLIVDLGLPDGSGLELIDEMARAAPAIDVLLATSGDPTLEAAAMAAGADGFLHKPVAALAAFQAAILSKMPPGRQPPGPRPLSGEIVDPDPLALRDDLLAISPVLDAGDADEVAYAARFVAGLAQSSGDLPLQDAAADLVRAEAGGAGRGLARSRLATLVHDRLADAPAP